MSEFDNEAPQFPEDRDGYGRGVPPEPTKSYAGWVTASAFAAISTLFGVLWQSQIATKNDLKENLKEEKRDSKQTKKELDSTIAVLRLDLLNCNDNALDDLDRKMKKAESMRLSSYSNYAKTDKEIQISKQNEANLKKATNSINRAIQNKTK